MREGDTAVHTVSKGKDVCRLAWSAVRRCAGRRCVGAHLPAPLPPRMTYSSAVESTLSTLCKWDGSGEGWKHHLERPVDLEVAGDGARRGLSARGAEMSKVAGMRERWRGRRLRAAGGGRGLEANLRVSTVHLILQRKTHR